MLRYFIQLSYDGTEYCGWQKQPESPSVQQTLEKSLSLILGSKTETTGCGRTDTAVSATKFYAHFDTERYLDPKDTIVRLNRMLPKDIAIHSIFQCGLHSRFDAVRREYRYYILKSKNAFNRHHWLITRPLDLPSMQKAADIMAQYNDFTSFAKLHGNSMTNICHIYSSYWESNPDGYIYTISADRFLRGMVRAVVGTLVDVGLHKITIDEFRSIIEAFDRSKASMQAPPQGLFLTDVRYPGF